MPEKQQQVSVNKIVWKDICFASSPTDCLRAYAYHKRERCSAPSWSACAAGKGIQYNSPGIHRYRTYANGRRVCDTVVCMACGVSVGKSARQRLEGHSKHVSDIHFGPLTRNVRTDYYRT